eukprot:CAMPEP_0201512564 /NCGR_PEP_ID=MMETSP0161_2-20130828/4793_1 /ASSEMBLY_ACC=CAM_ASM_000251 /TAXON_ID=180227 /ORGANISM="Neoparamoeba aestuarina, Strain SoJaBio B1-5/56/2" /LENGTH=317 /DNA_ID=CAMNT_0047908449 /DNA_START=235 /DNA_END=1185 /DNA_ORIENTATION=+
MEEAGMEIELQGVLRVESFIHAGGARQRVIFYAYPKDPNATPKQLPGDEESQQAKWMSMAEMEAMKKLPVPQGWRSSELTEWAEYLCQGGEIYPLSVLTKESSRVSVNSNNAWTIAPRNAPSSSSSSSSSSPSSSPISSSSNSDAFFHALTENNIESVGAMLEQNPQLVHLRNQPKQWTPLLHASRFLHVELMELLIDAGSDVNASTHKNRTPLHMVAQSGSEVAIAATELLLASGACVMVRDAEGMTVFDFASEPILKVLAEKEPFSHQAWLEMKKQNFNGPVQREKGSRKKDDGKKEKKEKEKKGKKEKKEKEKK